MTLDDDAFEGSMVADADADADADEACALTPEEGANDATRRDASRWWSFSNAMMTSSPDGRNGRRWGARDWCDRHRRWSPRDAWTVCAVVV